jgi:hypothetical protein
MTSLFSGTAQKPLPPQFLPLQPCLPYSELLQWKFCDKKYSLLNNAIKNLKAKFILSNDLFYSFLLKNFFKLPFIGKYHPKPCRIIESLEANKVVSAKFNV